MLSYQSFSLLFYYKNLKLSDKPYFVYNLNFLSLNIFQLLEEDFISFVRNELNKVQRVLGPDYPEPLEIEGEGDEEQKRCREAFLKFTVLFLRSRKHTELADCLWSSKTLD